MADLSQYLDNDLTLRAVGDKIVEQSKGRKRNYLGMSEIGNDCWRMLWYRFRNVLEEHLRLQSILAIEDGFKQEDIMAERLRLIDTIQLNTVDPDTGNQFEFKLLGGHFCGHCDGKIKGILEAPKTEHTWENKSVNEKKFKEVREDIFLGLDVLQKLNLEAQRERNKIDLVYKIYFPLMGLFLGTSCTYLYIYKYLKDNLNSQVFLIIEPILNIFS